MRFSRRSKFGAVKTTVDGIEFDSKAEAQRWSQLKLLERAGEIHRLQRQVRYDLIVNGVNLGFYKADFVYVNKQSATVVEDVKGFRTPVFTLKAKLMKALHGIFITEIGKVR